MFSSLFRLPTPIKRVCVWLADADADYYRNIRLSASLLAATTSSTHFAALYEAAEPFQAKYEAAAAEVARLRRLASADVANISFNSARIDELRVIDNENAELLQICSRLNTRVQKCESEHKSAGYVTRLRYRISQLEEENARLKATPPPADTTPTAPVLAPAPPLPTPTTDNELVASLRKEIQDLRTAKARAETQSELHQDRAARLLGEKQVLQSELRKVRSEAAQAVETLMKAARAEAERHVQEVDVPLRAEIDGLRLQVQQQDGAIAQLVMERETVVQSATAQLQMDLENEKKAGISRRMRLRRALRKEKAEAARQIGELEEEVSAELQKRGEQLRELTAAEQQVRELRREVAQWQEDWDEAVCENCETLQGLMETLEEEKQELEDERDDLKAENEDLRAELE